MVDVIRIYPCHVLEIETKNKFLTHQYFIKLICRFERYIIPFYYNGETDETIYR